MHTRQQRTIDDKCSFLSYWLTKMQQIKPLDIWFNFCQFMSKEWNICNFPSFHQYGYYYLNMCEVYMCMNYYGWSVAMATGHSGWCWLTLHNLSHSFSLSCKFGGTIDVTNVRVHLKPAVVSSRPLHAPPSERLLIRRVCGAGTSVNVSPAGPNQLLLIWTEPVLLRTGTSRR